MKQRSLDRLFTNLKIISRIHRYERISTRSSTVRIESNNVLQSLQRWWYSENRCKNIDIIECILNEAFDYTTYLLEGYRCKKSIEGLKRLTKLNTELCEVLKGLRNLRCTYENDSVVSARLDVLLERIEEYSTNINVTQPNDLP